MSRLERAVFRPSPEHANPRGVADFLSEVFAALALSPREVAVTVDLADASVARPFVLDLEHGEPVFRQEGARTVRGEFAGCWLAEHPVPLTLPLPRFCLWLSPADGGRVRVRTLPWYRRFANRASC